jgi:cation-transporting ATPase E
VPRHLTLVGTLTIGAPAFFLALAPSANRARPGFVTRVLRFSIPVGTLAAAATYLTYDLSIAEGVSLTEARTMATLVLVSIGFFALQINSRPMTPGRRVLIGTMVGVFLIVLFSPGWREFFELSLPDAVVLLAGVGIVAITGSVLYGALRAIGWIKMMPDLIAASPLAEGGPMEAVRTGMSRLRERARRIGEPMPPERFVSDEEERPQS